jgi:hypothetical protein
MLRAKLVSGCRLILIGLSLAAAALPAPAKNKNAMPRKAWRDTFSVSKTDLADSGRSAYFSLEPGSRRHFEHGDERLVITVLPETRVVDGVRTRVVEERETKGGQLVEVSRNYFALDRKTGDVYYFGEDVDIYRNGRVGSHEGAWRAGVNGARFGLMMPGRPKIGDRYQQEVAPGIAMDRAEIVSNQDSLETPAGTFRHCVRTRESSATESGSEDKLYAPGVGLIKDDKLVLVKVDTARS